MKFEEMMKEGLIKKLQIDKKNVRETFEIARRDLRTAEKILEEDCDWAFSIAYNSMLQAGRALMFSKGYRPSGEAQHVSVVRFVELFFEKERRGMTVAFERMRRKRHTAVYRRIGFVSETEATNALKQAEEFVNEIEIILKKDGVF